MSQPLTRKSVIARILCTTAAAWLLSANPVYAHNVWLEPDTQGGYVMQFGGHEGKTETFDPAKLQRVHAYDLRGRDVNCEVQNVRGGIRVKPDAKAALIAVELDNGYFSSAKPDGDMLPLSMDKNPGAVRGVYARKFHKTVVQWGAVMQKPLGQMFEVVPLTGQAPHAGQPLKLQVLLNGKPLAGARLSWGESGTPTLSDAQGMATMKPAAGSNALQAIWRQEVQGDVKTTQHSYEYLLKFSAH
ncbi:DUF4198 domain-containing protein [Comamonas sp. Y33R10-2]|uniref:DUF4198 domain-containing protein n=1 Tax=Comamonas sp. Y33R10-2 TaxID=2853257 RepID=UPI001C5CB1D7|nr:DUF4198 domain-containing protein [Comamonas sp. Y33R10-2]QXZ09096.1 DUF4198 domain-containing protein [Comamonas sp. Y33R10-2]